MLIPLLCASGAHVENVSGYPLNYYIGNGMEANAKGVEQAEAIRDKKAIKMVHLLNTHDTAKFYKVNEEYIPFLRSLGRVGLTVHFSDNPRTPEQRNIWFEQLLRIHFELPEAVFYVENSHHDLLDLTQVVFTLRQIGIESYMLLDTCHLEMDKYDCLHCAKNKYDYRDLFTQFKDIIGGFHISASQGEDGYSFDRHGKPINGQKDEAFFREICQAIADTDFTNDVYVIPEIKESTYNRGCMRRNGIAAYDIICEYCNKANRERMGKLA